MIKVGKRSQNSRNYIFQVTSTHMVRISMRLLQGVPKHSKDTYSHYSFANCKHSPGEYIHTTIANMRVLQIVSTHKVRTFMQLSQIIGTQLTRWGHSDDYRKL